MGSKKNTSTTKPSTIADRLWQFQVQLDAKKYRR